MQAFDRAIGWFANITMGIGAVAVVLMLFHVTVDVILKLMIGTQLLGTIETVANYYMVACVFLPLAMVERDRNRIVVELFTEQLSPRTNAFIDGLVAVSALVYVGALGYAGTIVAYEMTVVREQSVNQEYFLEVWPSRWFVVLGFLGMAVHFLRNGIADFHFALTGRGERGTTAGRKAKTVPAEIE